MGAFIFVCFRGSYCAGGYIGVGSGGGTWGGVDGGGDFLRP